jgi:hypothetical protein
MNKQMEIRKSDRRLERQKRHRAAALHDFAEGVARNPSRQRRRVRQPYAALTCVHRQGPAPLDFGSCSFFGAWCLELGVS